MIKLLMSSRASIYHILCLLVFTALMSCGSHDGSDTESVKTDTPDIRISYTDSIYSLTDTFTKIKRSICGESDITADSFLDYTNENACFLPVHFLDPTAEFLYISDVDCGSPGGTCGEYISLIRRTARGAYDQKIQVCGHIDSVDFSTAHLYYTTTTDHKQYLLDFSSAEPAVEYLSINHIPVYETEYIGDNLNILSENLVFNGEESDNPDAIYVSFHKVDLNQTLSLAVYTLKNNNIPYSYAFLRSNSRPLRNVCVGGAGHISWSSKQNGIFIEYQTGQEIQQYKIDTEKKLFVKI